MSRNRNVTGFTLIELMITVAIVGILAGIAYPSYRESVLKSGRTSAKTALIKAAQDLERCYTRLNVYNVITVTSGVPDCNIAYSLRTSSTTFDTADGKYRISATDTGGSWSLGANTFILRATPLGPQLRDAKCLAFVLDNADNKNVTGTSSANPKDCW